MNKRSNEVMIPKVLNNNELGYNLHYWDGIKKNERIFLSSELMKQLGYKGGTKTLHYYELEEGVDMIKVTKVSYPEFFTQLEEMKSIGQRASKVILLYESGVNKLIMGSRKPIGILTRNWLAREVLPSIRNNGKYEIKNSLTNPFSALFPMTERKIQLDNSKYINSLIHEKGEDFREYHNKVHMLVSGMDAKSIKKMFNSKESAREILRTQLPENAATNALIDDLFLRYNKSLKEIENSGIHVSGKLVFKSLFDLGIDPIAWCNDNESKNKLGY